MGKGIELSSFPLSLNILRLSNVEFDYYCLHVGRFADAPRPEMLWSSWQCEEWWERELCRLQRQEFRTFCACVCVHSQCIFKGCANVGFCTPSWLVSYFSLLSPHHFSLAIASIFLWLFEGAYFLHGNLPYWALGPAGHGPPVAGLSRAFQLAGREAL